MARRETLAEYLARDGKVTQCKPVEVKVKRRMLLGENRGMTSFCIGYRGETHARWPSNYSGASSYGRARHGKR